MACIVTRSNGIVTQVWEDNDASWDFLIGGMSKDIQWHNMNGKECPKLFKDFHQACVYLEMRSKRLKPVEKKNEKEWEYHIMEVKDDVDHHKEK